jgi:hypothetical protein
VATTATCKPPLFRASNHSRPAYLLAEWVDPSPGSFIRYTSTKDMMDKCWGQFPFITSAPRRRMLKPYTKEGYECEWLEQL